MQHLLYKSHQKNSTLTPFNILNPKMLYACLADSCLLSSHALQNLSKHTIVQENA